MQQPAVSSTFPGSQGIRGLGGPFFPELSLFEATRLEGYLERAEKAADWLLVWTYFHDIDLPSDPLLDSAPNTVGWTMISLHNKEIDVFGYWLGPEFYKLGLLSREGFL